MDERRKAEGQKKDQAAPAKKEKKENIHEGHRRRKREQFFLSGADSFADHELLELLLFYAKPRADTNYTAHKLLERFGSLESVFAAPVEELAQVEGIGKSSATLVALIAPLYRRAIISSVKNEQILDTTERLGAYFKNLFVAEKREIMYQLCLDAKGRRLNLLKINEGGVAGVSFDLRKIVANALSSNAAMVVLAHNHPNGLAVPSSEDRVSTAEVQEALRTIDVALVDHIIVADNDFVSLRDSHMMRI